VNEELVAAAGVEVGGRRAGDRPGHRGSLSAALLEAGATIFAVERVGPSHAFP
jgi:hypothetical protein